MKKAMFRQQYAEEDDIKVISKKVEEIVEEEPVKVADEETTKEMKEINETLREKNKRGRKHNI